MATFGDRLKNKIRILGNGLVSSLFGTVLIYIKRIAGSRVMMGNHHHVSRLFFKTNVTFTLPTLFSNRP